MQTTVPHSAPRTDPAQRPGSARGDLRPQRLDPVGGVTPRLLGLAADPGAVLTGSVVRAQEEDVLVLGLEVAQGVGHQLVADVALEVDDEAVVAEAALGGTALEAAQVDAARRELLEDREQRARDIGLLE